jgi:hypothetical protein
MRSWNARTYWQSGSDAAGRVSEQPKQTPVVSVDRREQQFVDQLRGRPGMPSIHRR